MRTPQVTVPALRADIAAKRFGGRLVIEDPLRRVRVPIDELTFKVIDELAGGPARPEALCKATRSSRYEVWRRVRLLNEHLALDTPRAREQGAIHRHAAAASEALPDPATAPLRFPGDLRHGCVACGACCHGTDVGPLTAEDIAHIEAVDWTQHLPSPIPREAWIVEAIDPRGEKVAMTGRHEGRCVFLGESKLCVIHSVAGATHKPTVCQQFPYTFTRTPRGIDVSFSMECRSWWAARQQGRPVADEEAELRRMLGIGSILEVPTPIAVWSGVDLDLDGWEAVRADMIARATAAVDVAGLVRALVEPAREAFAGVHARHAEAERFAERDAWALPAGGVVGGEATARFIATRDGVRARLDAGLHELGAELAAAGRPEERDRAERLRWVVDALLSGRRADDLIRFEHELEIRRDLVLAALYGHEPARAGALLFGVARLVLKLLASHLLSGLAAQTALRGRTTEQDAVDSVVLLTKMLRGSAFSKLLKGSRRELVELFVENAEAFASGAAPRHPHSQLEIR